MAQQYKTPRQLASQERIDNATQDAFELALDCLHDMELQQALFRRLEKEVTNVPVAQ